MPRDYRTEIPMRLKNMSGQTEFDVVEDNGTVKTVECQHCGNEQDTRTDLAVASGRIKCRGCGREKPLGRHPGAMIVALGSAIVLLAVLKFADWIKRVMPCD